MYDGSLSTGQVTWTLLQAGNTVSGSGSFTASADTAHSSYAIRGTTLDDNLNLRLVGAPGDTNADSVTYSGVFDTRLLAGGSFHGVLGGHSPVLFGQLIINLRSPP